MIRIQESAGWLLIEHRDHARLAGDFARRWGNAEFAPPEPRDAILDAVYRHDDAWVERDSAPSLTRAGLPAAFSRELVGTYSAFEEIDLADYLRVRGRATEAVAADHPFAAIIVSMHTVNLLTDQADLSQLSPADRTLHTTFIAGQHRRQAELTTIVREANPALTSAVLQRAFEFLQVCDNLSLLACARYPEPRDLRHRHPRRDGTLATLRCTPLGADTYRLAPFPFDADHASFVFPYRRLPLNGFTTQDEFRACYAAVPVEQLSVLIVR
jgi:Protein of unknown function (DUF3891)